MARTHELSVCQCVVVNFVDIYKPSGAGKYSRADLRFLFSSFAKDASPVTSAAKSLIASYA